MAGAAASFYLDFVGLLADSASAAEGGDAAVAALRDAVLLTDALSERRVHHCARPKVSLSVDEVPSISSNEVQVSSIVSAESTDARIDTVQPQHVSECAIRPN